MGSGPVLGKKTEVWPLSLELLAWRDAVHQTSRSAGLCTQGGPEREAQLHLRRRHHRPRLA
jgi:hypothetical protein